MEKFPRDAVPDEVGSPLPLRQSYEILGSVCIDVMR